MRLTPVPFFREPGPLPPYDSLPLQVTPLGLITRLYRVYIERINCEACNEHPAANYVAWGANSELLCVGCTAVAERCHEASDGVSL